MDKGSTATKLKTDDSDFYTSTNQAQNIAEEVINQQQESTVSNSATEVAKVYVQQTKEGYDIQPNETVVVLPAVPEKTEYSVEILEKVKKKPFYSFFKRAFDMLASGLCLLILLLPLIIVAVIIKCGSKGPVLYKQERLGKNGKPFTMLKFRSMRLDAEAHGAQWAVDDDPRCTKFGKFMRKSRIDELPQLINIFCGQMSIVGPRPERKVFYDEFETYIHGFSERLRVKPGLTGLAQVNGGYDLKPEEKVIYDIKYIKTRSLWLDLKIIFKTIGVVFSHKGAK